MNLLFHFFHFSTFPLAAGSHRVIFIDLARSLAVVFMLYGHTVSALLAPEYTVGRWYAIWTFQRGLTSSLFLLLSGFAFSIATSRHWPLHVRVTSAVLKRARRFALFIVLGYALHFPVSRFVDMVSVSDAGWRSFLAVDVLQLIGVTFIGVQVLVMVSRSRPVFTVAAFALAAIVVCATPLVWSADWTGVLPPPLAAYLTPSSGSLFPMFPWAAFVLVGAGLGQLYVRRGAPDLSRYALNALMLPGAFLLAAGLALGVMPAAIFGSGPWSGVPSDVALRLGACLAVLAVIAHASRRINRLPRVFGAVAQETLLIYFVHLCIVYGSVWNRGLFQIYGETLSPAETVLWVMLLVVSMSLLAWQWNWVKHVRPPLARWISVGVGGLLLYRLL